MDDRKFAQLLEYTGRSWRGYRRVRKGVKKRIRRHMQSLDCRDVRAYLGRLETDSTAREECEMLMSVSISRFFRDRRLWERLETHFLPLLMDTWTDTVRAWCAGCACGEEVYSLRILWDITVGTKNRHPALEITATDMNPVYLERARKGVYAASSFKEVPGDVKRTCFRAGKDGHGFEVIEPLRKGIRWRLMDLRREAPSGRSFQLILLRNNILTYYKEVFQATALETILERLISGGLLVIGSHERLPFERPDLTPDRELSYLYRKS